jgi:4-amino-4-deoxy-L-arabinose transferase-like glycosyltransferase
MQGLREPTAKGIAFTPRLRLVIILMLAAYLAAGIASALTQRPWCDEAWNSSPALSLITRGFMGTPAIETAGAAWKGIDRYTYWIMPLHPLSQIPFYEVFGFGVLTLRASSVFWGLVALFSWIVIVRRLAGDSLAAVISFGLMATDFIFVQRSSEGRMDIMSAALGFAAFAVYVMLRERHLASAILASHALVCASCLTHPNGIMAVAALVFLTLYFDGRRLRFIHLAAAAVPYVAGLAGWGWYVSQAPELARIQLGGNASGRFRGFQAPLSALVAELKIRYLRSIAGWSSDLSLAHHAKIVVLLSYITGLAGVIATRELRSKPGIRALLGMTAIYFAFLTWYEGMKQPLYLIHIVPFFLALLGIWAANLWLKGQYRAGLALAGLVLLAVQLGGVAYVVRRNTWRNAYRPVIAYLKQHAAHARVMGSAELGFELGFFENLTDDTRLGYDSGRHPDFIVVETRYAEWFQGYKQKDPQVYGFI